jgi:hypothetical protein
MRVKYGNGAHDKAMKSASLCTSSALVALLLGSLASATEPVIANMSWMAGCWASENAERGSGENWMPLAGGTMLGTSRTVKQGMTVAFEFMELRHLPDGRLAFIAHPSGGSATVFPLVHITETEATFENASHDFPQRIVYSRGGGFKLRARIEGTLHGKLRVIEFRLARVSCDAQLASSSS